MTRPWSVLVLALALSQPRLQAQHDAHRNAVRDLASGRPAQADRQLLAAPATHSETHFVRMLLALHEGHLDRGTRHAEAALAAGLPFGRLLAGPRQLLAPLRASDEFTRWRKTRSLRLVHGPMLGCLTDEAASFWVRTAAPAAVRVRILDEDREILTESEPAHSTTTSDLTAVVRITGLAAATRYRYEVLVDGQPVRTEQQAFRTFPAPARPARFSIAFGGGAGFVPERERMWDVIASHRPDALLMLGDNVYIDDPLHALTQHYCYYRRQSRPEWRRLTASTPIYALWDDHDFGIDDCTPGNEIETPAWKRRVWQVFRQNWVNPRYGGGAEQPGCWYDFVIADVHFLMLDSRYYRSRDDPASMLGPAQKQWLFDSLRTSAARIKVIASPVPFSRGVKPGSKDPWDGFPAEREELFTFLEQHLISGVILLAADRHRSDLRVTKRPAGYDLYEFESSKLTNRHTHPVIKTDGLIWGYNDKCSFGLVSFDTTRDDPLIRFEVVTIDGERVHGHELYASDLQLGK